MNTFYPPVIFEVKAKAMEAIAEFKKINAELTKMEAKADKASLSMMKIEKAAKLTKIALAGAALTFGVFAAAGLKAAMDQEAAMTRLQIAVQNAGQSFQAAYPLITETSNALVKLGFHDEETYGSLAKLTAATGNVKTAMKAMSVAADLARFKQISLAEASDLIARATTGQARGLRDLGIAMGQNIDKGATLEDILKAIEDRTKGTAEAFSKTAAGGLKTFDAQLDQLKEQVGFALLPALIKVTNWLNTSLLPTLSKFFGFLDRNKTILINFGLAFAAIWSFAKIQAGITAAITAIRLLVGGYNTLKVSAIAAAVAERLAINPLLGAAAVAITLGAIVKTIADVKKTNEEVKDLKVNLGGIGDGTNRAGDGLNKLSDALINAKQRVTDFNTAIKSTFVDLKGAWAAIAGRDSNAAIQEGLLNPIDKLVTKTQTAINAYQSASNQYQGALSQLTFAQNNYTNAVKSGNKTLIASTESALKRAEDLVKSLQDGMGAALKDITQLQQEMIDAVVETENKLTELRLERKKVLDDSLKDELALQKDYNAKVLQLQQDAARRSAEIVKQSVDQFRSAFKGSTYRSIGDIFSGLTFEGKYLKGGSIEAITNALAVQSQKATSLADKAGKLQALGFTQTFIEEVISQGPDVGGALADTIISGTPASVAQLQSYWVALEKVSSHGVDTIARKMNSGITLATEELTAQLAGVQTELTSALSLAFDEYTSALDTIRAKTSEQIKLIDDQITELNKKIDQLKTALASLSNLSAPGVYATAPSVTIPSTPSAPYNPAAGTPFGQAGGNTQNINIYQNNSTNASPDDIAKSTAWVIRTSSDVSFTGPAKYNVASKEYVAPKAVRTSTRGD